MNGTEALPLVLAGPILRRVEVTRVCVWIATSCAAHIEGLLYSAVPGVHYPAIQRAYPAALTAQLGHGETETLAFGDALHIAVVEIAPTAVPWFRPQEFLVFFDWDKATLTPEAKKIIAHAAIRAKASAAKTIKVTGHTDRSGTPEHNRPLSIRRAEAVKAELVKFDIPQAAILTEGKGEEDPLVPTADGVREQRNRRVSIAFPIQIFPASNLLAYDLWFKFVGKNGKTLGQHWLSELTVQDGRNVLAYDGYSYPTFFIDSDSLNILHGSCRKAHGNGDDALTSADLLVGDAPADLTKRPSALFLTGDQIYADDVHDALIKTASQLGRRLLGFDERLPEVPAPVHTINPAMRRKLASQFFTPDPDAKNQLLGFGDFAGLYLLALSDALWPESLTPPSDNLTRFRKALPAVRRALANIATYMTFDDHELADDWNISKAWGDNARRSPLGRRVIAHALCAYWAFQGWGNEPAAFGETFRNGIVDYFRSHQKDGSAFEATMIDKPPLWSFVAPTRPPVFFLDSRTRRAASGVRAAAGGVRHDAPSAVLDDDALRDFLTEAGNRGMSGSWLVVVAAGPVFGSPENEGYIEKKYFKEETKGDLDWCHANRAGYYKLLRVMHEIRPLGCVILSGDVHYAFVSRASVSVDGTMIHFTQFTSSALKNDAGSFGARRVGLPATAYRHNPRGEQGWLRAPASTRVDLPPRVREILSTSPTVLTIEEVLQAGVKVKGDTSIVSQVIRPTDPKDGPFLHTQRNIGQLVLPPNGKAILRLYGAGSKNAFATYTVQLDQPHRGIE